MKTPLVSVIVPVYNVEKYLKKCLDSILKQTYSNIEVILVDDGSTDGSGRICDECVKKDKRFRVVHQKNGGVAVARNTGLSKAKGEYIAFIDSDDWVKKEYIERLMQEAQEKNADVVQCEQITVSKENEYIIYDDAEKYNKVISGYEACEEMLYQNVVTSALWGKIIRSKLFDGLSFKSGIIHEDLLMLYRIFKKAKEVSVIGDLLYYYFEREDSLIRKAFSKNTLDVLDVVDEILEDTDGDDRLHAAAISRKTNADFFVLRQLPTGQKRSGRKMKKEIAKYRKSLLKNPKVRKKTKVALRLSYFGMPVVKAAFKATRNIKTVRRVN